jgi:WD40 repeat protein
MLRLYQLLLPSVATRFIAALLVIVCLVLSISLYSVVSPLEHVIATPHDIVTSIALVNDQMLASVGNDPTLRFWSLNTGREVGQLSSGVGWRRSIVYIQENQLVAGPGWDGSIRLWDTEHRIQHASLLTGAEHVNALAVCSARQELVSGGNDGVVRIWNLSSMSLKSVSQTLDSRVLAIGVAESGPNYFIGLDDGRVVRWSGQPTHVPETLYSHQAYITSLAVPCNGEFVISGDWLGTIIRWNLCSSSIDFRHSLNGVNALRLCGDNQLLVVGTGVVSAPWPIGRPGDVRLLRADTGRQLEFFNWHWGPVSCLAVDGDRSLVISGCYDGKIRFWKSKVLAARRKAILSNAE